MGRPLPILTPWNRPFWTSGSDGELRILRCGACGTWVHPPVPVCPACQSDDVTPVAVAGTGTVAALTVNHQRWGPGPDPPYVIAIVELDGVPGVRLTTNIVNADPSSVAIGTRVDARFEPVDDVWLPVFAPLDEPVVEPSPPAHPNHLAPPPLRPARKFEDAAVISGVGMSTLGRRLGRHPMSLAADAARAAVADAGLTLADIDGVATYPAFSVLTHGMSEGGVYDLTVSLGLRPTWFMGGDQIPGQAGPIAEAAMAINAGLCRNVLCVRTVWQGTFADLQRRGELRLPGGRVGDDMQWRVPYGAPSAANWIGMLATRHMREFGTTRPQLGAIALNARRHAALNPTAIYRDPLTMDDYLSARIVSTPFGLYDCDVPCDASIAVVVSSREVAADLPQPAVAFEAFGLQMAEVVSWDQGTIIHEPQVWGPARHLWTRTDLTPADVDVALLYDGFTFNCLTWLEALGFCGVGEGGQFVEGGARIALGGELPLNPHGGQLSAGRTHGFGFIHEAVVQLRQQAGERQVAGAEVACVSTGGGTPGGAMLLTRRR
jgi:acetyl-CoA acetyltransferase/uncharacterized OB-fold protein